MVLRAPAKDAAARLDPQPNDAIRHARFFEQYELAWAEDLLQVGTLGSGDAPKNWRAYKEIKEDIHRLAARHFAAGERRPSISAEDLL